MSFNMHARPIPIEKPPSETFYFLKFPLAKLGVFDGDGSLRSSGGRLTEKWVPKLEAMAAAGSRDIAEECEALIKLIKDNPQGVVVWIGEENDQ